MPSPESRNSLILEQFPLKDQKIHVREYAGGGNAAYVFKVRIGDRKYALKMFKFDHPLLYPSRLQGTRRRAVFDNFIIECRTNGVLIAKGLNGKSTPFCYGWILVSTPVEMRVAAKWNVQPFLWDRPPAAANEQVRAILYEWIDGKLLSETRLTSHIADQIRDTLKELHQASMAHGDIRGANIIVRKDGVYLIDLNSSLVLSPEVSSPRLQKSQTKLQGAQEHDLRDLKIGFAFLSRFPINENVSVADLSSLGCSSVDEVLEKYASWDRNWQPLVPTFWHKPIRRMS
ncbi:hypothetical protein F5884DRAFT_855767 [Xylogone sp. PMI_703]|nr:hypothetical protein F5884DRAFT_855767 [Xylogone sp. PMI_703]